MTAARLFVVFKYSDPVDADSLNVSEDFSRLPITWVEFLPRSDSDIPNLDALYTKPSSVLPERNHIFRAFHATPPENVRVVLVGQDPYSDLGKADGLAFSQQGKTDKRSALHRLFRNLERDPVIAFNYPSTGNLMQWALEGVLLMNAALTVETGQPKSHLAMWKSFSRSVLHGLSNPSRRIAFILLGADAIEMALPALATVSAESIVRAAHPMAGNPGNERPFNSAHVFSEANRVLSGTAIKWDLN